MESKTLIIFVYRQIANDEPTLRYAILNNNNKFSSQYETIDDCANYINKSIIRQNAKFAIGIISRPPVDISIEPGKACYDNEDLEKEERKELLSKLQYR